MTPYEIKFRFKISASVKRYFKENLGAPFIIGFQSLLLACGGLLALENPGLANDIAVYAYYLLVIGVVLQMISFARYEREDHRKNGR